MDSMDAIMDTNSSVYEEGNKFIVEYPDCVFCKKLSTSRPCCFMEIGFLMGIERYIGKGYKISETKCRGKGDNICRFKIEKV